jgi:ubiquinone/menaquinone biosynthesis C-methylase UbiE
MSDHILEYWQSQAKKHGISHRASWGDNLAIDLEIKEIQKHIKKGDAVLDIGCANGYSMMHYVSCKPKSITGIDFSKEMIKQAKMLDLNKIECQIHFDHGDIRNLPYEDNSFDMVYTTRVLINLPNWENQKEGINECIRVCRPGGKVLFSEGFFEPMELLNKMRALCSLSSLKQHEFNRYIKFEELKSFLTEKLINYEQIDFSSMYYLGSRFVRELVTDPSDYTGYSNPINKIFYEIEQSYSGGGFGIQQMFVLNL